MKPFEIVFYQREWSGNGWRYDFPTTELESFLLETQQDLKKFNIGLSTAKEEVTIQIRGYADLLNSIRLRFPSAGLGNLCLGHVVGSSPNRNILEDLRRGINRVVFAPETVEPEGSDKITCHNCGCGC